MLSVGKVFENYQHVKNVLKAQSKAYQCEFVTKKSELSQSDDPERPYKMKLLTCNTPATEHIRLNLKKAGLEKDKYQISSMELLNVVPEQILDYLNDDPQRQVQAQAQNNTCQVIRLSDNIHVAIDDSALIQSDHGFLVVAIKEDMQGNYSFEGDILHILENTVAFDSHTIIRDLYLANGHEATLESLISGSGCVYALPDLLYKHALDMESVGMSATTSEPCETTCQFTHGFLFAEFKKYSERIYSIQDRMYHILHNTISFSAAFAIKRASNIPFSLLSGASSFSN